MYFFVLEWDNVQIGQPRSIKIIGNDYPIGIGLTLKNSNEIYATGFRDPGLHVHHYYSDELWKNSGKVKPDDSFIEKMVIPMYSSRVEEKKKKNRWPYLIKVRAKGPNSLVLKGIYVRQIKDKIYKKPIYKHLNFDIIISWSNEKNVWSFTYTDYLDTFEVIAKCNCEVDEPCKTQGNDWFIFDHDLKDYIVGGISFRKEFNDIKNEINTSEKYSKKKKFKIKQSKRSTQNKKKEENFISACFSKEKKDSIYNMDDLMIILFNKCLFNLTKKDFPMLIPDLYSLMRIENKSLDVKLSSFKKLKNFIKVMKQEGKIKIKEKKGKMWIEKINQEHKELLNYNNIVRTQRRLDQCKISQNHYLKLLTFLDDGKKNLNRKFIKNIKNMISKKFFPKKNSRIGKCLTASDLLEFLFDDISLLQKLDAQTALSQNKRETNNNSFLKLRERKINDYTIFNLFNVTICYYINDENLPLDENYILKLMEQKNKNISLENSTWCNIKYFLLIMQKKKILRLNKENIKQHILTIEEINREHPLSSKIKKINNKTNSTSQFDDPKFLKSKIKAGNLLIIKMYSPTGQLNSIFHKEKKLFTIQEAKNKLWNWIKNEELFNVNDKNKIKITRLTWKIILKTKTKTNFFFEAPYEISWKVFFKQFKYYLHKYVAVILPGKTKFKQGNLSKIKIFVEKRQGGKKSTTFIWGLEIYGINEKEFSKLTNKKFSSSTSVQKLNGRQRENLLFVKIQGNVVIKIEKLLSDFSKYGIPRNFINSTTKRPF